MTIVSRLVLAAVFAAVAGCSSSAEKPDQISISFAPPADEDAIPLEEKFESKDAARKKLGEPIRTKALIPSDESSCTERYFYSGKADLPGFGPFDLLMYVDFDANGKSCASHKQ